MSAQITRFVRTCVELAKETVVGQPSPALKRGEGGDADWVMISILCLREREGETFRSVVDKLKVMDPIRAELGIERDELPDPSTLCKALDRLPTALFRRLLDKSVTIFEFGEVTAIDASGFDRGGSQPTIRPTNRLSLSGDEYRSSRTAKLGRFWTFIVRLVGHMIHRSAGKSSRGISTKSAL